MSTRKMFNDIRSLKEEAKGDVFSLTDEVGMKTSGTKQSKIELSREQ